MVLKSTVWSLLSYIYVVKKREVALIVSHVNWIQVISFVVVANEGLLVINISFCLFVCLSTSWLKPLFWFFELLPLEILTTPRQLKTFFWLWVLPYSNQSVMLKKDFNTNDSSFQTSRKDDITMLKTMYEGTSKYIQQWINSKITEYEILSTIYFSAM